MKEVGTLKELGVCVGDVVEYGGIGDKYTICDNQVLKSHQTGKSSYYQCWDTCNQFRIIARANQPKLWKDMTAEEKGALLLAAHEGNVVEQNVPVCNCTGEVTSYDWIYCPTGNIGYKDCRAYRIKQESKVETVTMLGGTECGVYGYGFYVVDEAVMQTHKITFTTIDGKPDCASVKMEEL